MPSLLTAAAVPVTQLFIARELGIAAVVGCGDATEVLKDGQEVTVSCAEGDTGNIYNGLIPFEIKEVKQANCLRSPLRS